MVCVIIYLMDDVKFMKRAISLARRAEGRTSPNPLVGSVIVRDGMIIAEGYHRKAGRPHAEAVALEAAGSSARGCTLYVNLEPCCHRDKRTPPCTDAIIAAGIKRVVAAMKDPNPRVSGRGLEMLRRHGIEVTVGVMEREAGRLNEFYAKHITTGRPFVILKTAMTMDGKIATPEGESKWISSGSSRRMVHRLRKRVDAILSAIGTVRADNPRFTARIRGGTDPVRVIIDPELETPEGSHVLSCPPRTILVTKKTVKRTEQLKEAGVEFIHFEETLDLDELMKTLGRMGITSVMIEGGSSLASYALNSGIVDRVMYFIAPKIIGGMDSYPAVGGRGHRKIEEAIRIRDMTVRRIGEDVLIEGTPELPS